MLVATSEVRLGDAGMRSTLALERAVRVSVILRDKLAYDTRFAAAAAGKPERVAHVFMLAAGRLVAAGGEPVTAPAAFVLADDEIERVGRASRTFRTDGERVHVVQLRLALAALRAPIGVGHGPVAVSDACWDVAGRLCAGDIALAALLDELARCGVVDGSVATTLCADEPERFRRLWAAIEPLYASYGTGTSLKQIASSLGMSMRQVGRDAKELATTFGVGGGYRDAILVLRLRVAVLLLSAAGATIGDVAKAVGYGSAIAMARAFRDAKLPPPSVVQAALAPE
jgi:AraC-like DNA-binding protein